MAAIIRGLSKTCPAVQLDSQQALGNKRWCVSDSTQGGERNRAVAPTKSHSVPASELLGKTSRKNGFRVAQSDRLGLP
jgi:hypothetical protein